MMAAAVMLVSVVQYVEGVRSFYYSNILAYTRLFSFFPDFIENAETV
jgi:hypothetical protein